MKILPNKPRQLRAERPKLEKPQAKTARHRGDRFTPSSLGASPKKWTCLFFLAADDSLDEFLSNNLKDLQKIGSGPEINLAAQITRRSEKPALKGRLESRRYFFTESKTAQILEQTACPEITNPDNLEQFVGWGMKNYPAQNYLVVIGSHGGGMAGVIQDSRKDKFIPLPQIAQALENAEKQSGVDKNRVLLGFDACLMGQAEAAYELKDTAAIMIASQEEIMGNGWPYADFLRKAQIAEASPQEMAKQIIKSGKMHPNEIKTLTTLDLNRMPKLKTALDGLAKAILDDRKNVREIKRQIAQSQSFDNTALELKFNYRDLYSIADRLEKSLKSANPRLADAAGQLKTALKDTIILETHQPDFPESHGLSIYPGYAADDFARYQLGDLKLSRESLWCKAMQKLYR